MSMATIRLHKMNFPHDIYTCIQRENKEANIVLCFIMALITSPIAAILHIAT